MSLLCQRYSYFFEFRLKIIFIILILISQLVQSKNQSIQEFSPVQFNKNKISPTISPFILDSDDSMLEKDHSASCNNFSNCKINISEFDSKFKLIEQAKAKSICLYCFIRNKQRSCVTKRCNFPSFRMVFEKGIMSKKNKTLESLAKCNCIKEKYEFYSQYMALYNNSEEALLNISQQLKHEYLNFSNNM